MQTRQLTLTEKGKNLTLRIVQRISVIFEANRALYDKSMKLGTLIA